MQVANNVTFKSAYPVAHWVAETNGSFAPVSNMQLVKKLQGKLVRVLNKPLAESKKNFNSTEQTIRAYIGSSDADYRNTSHVRSFYNRMTNSSNKFVPVSYIISGNDVAVFEEKLAQNIGKAKAQAKELLKKPYSEETIKALKLYNSKGLEFVKNSAKQIKDENGISYILHTKFEIIRNKLGKIKDYKLLDVRFLPASGKKNPLERLG